MKERFNPEMYVRYYTAERGISVEDIGVAPVVVLSWGQRVIESLASAVGAQVSRHWFYDEGHVVFRLYSGSVKGQHVSFVLAPEGAPATVVMMEELIACGARVILSIGWAGSLQPYAPVGTMLIPIKCIRDEGTSLHYVDKNVTLEPDEGLLKLLEAACREVGADVVCGVQWTTDAPYRELVSRIVSYGEQGVIGVDMETSAMYALGKFRGIRVCNLLVVSDELWSEWRPAFRSLELKQATEQAQRIILRCLDSLSECG